MVLGKFMPFHNGHKYLIDSAISRTTGQVYVYVCTRDCEPLNGKKRYELIKNTYRNNELVTIIHVDDNSLPQEPEESPNFWSIWYDVVYSRLSKDIKLDAIFCSENYGEKFSQILGIENVVVDLERNLIPISGTAVRANIFKNWRQLPLETRRWLTQKIAIVGPESCGKTTMMYKLADYFRADYLEEYGREYTNHINLTKFGLNDAENIARKHIELYQNKISEAKSNLIFFDTELMTTASWSELLCNNRVPEFILDNMFTNNNHFDLILFLLPTVKWVDDGTRIFDKRRIEHQNRIQEYLDQYSSVYPNTHICVINDSDYTKRFEVATDKIRNLFSIDKELCFQQ